MFTSYCRWNNASLEMEECLAAMNAWMEENNNFSRKSYAESLSEEEQVSFRRFWKLLEDFEAIKQQSIRCESIWGRIRMNCERRSEKLHYDGYDIFKYEEEDGWLIANDDDMIFASTIEEAKEIIDKLNTRLGAHSNG